MLWQLEDRKSFWLACTLPRYKSSFVKCLMSVIWNESSDPVDIKVTDTSLIYWMLSARVLKIKEKLDSCHLKSLFCFAENLFLISKWYSLDHWLSRSAHRYRWPSHSLISFWTSQPHWLSLLHLFSYRFSLCFPRKQSHTLKVPCYQKKRKRNGWIGHSEIIVACNVFKSAKHFLTKL